MPDRRVPTATCPDCGALVEVEHTTITTWWNVPLRCDPIQTEAEALAEHMERCPSREHLELDH